MRVGIDIKDTWNASRLVLRWEKTLVGILVDHYGNEIFIDQRCYFLIPKGSFGKFCTPFTAMIDNDKHDELTLFYCFSTCLVKVFTKT